MKAIATTGWGLKPVLSLIETDEPGGLKPDDVLVAVHAASVNPKDWKLNYNLAVAASPVMVRHLPPLFGDDLAGIVVDKGRNVRDFEIGDAVYGMDMRLRTASLAELARISQRRIAKKPENLSFAQAAAMPLASLTALQGLHKGKAEAGKSVLIIGAALLGKKGYFISTGGDGKSMLGTPFYRLLGKKAGTVVVESYRRDLETLKAMVEAGTLTPIIDSTFTLAESEAAYNRSRSGRCRGKVVIEVAEN